MLNLHSEPRPRMAAVVGVSGSRGTVEQDVNILESALREATTPALAAAS